VPSAKTITQDCEFDASQVVVALLLLSPESVKDEKAITDTERAIKKIVFFILNCF
jgi:hypothetical protein